MTSRDALSTSLVDAALAKLDQVAYVRFASVYRQFEDVNEFMDELEFLESLSLDDADSFDAVSAMLDEDEDSEGDGESRDKTEDH